MLLNHRERSPSAGRFGEVKLVCAQEGSGHHTRQTLQVYSVPKSSLEGTWKSFDETQFLATGPWAGVTKARSECCDLRGRCAADQIISWGLRGAQHEETGWGRPSEMIRSEGCRRDVTQGHNTEETCMFLCMYVCTDGWIHVCMHAAGTGVRRLSA